MDQTIRNVTISPDATQTLSDKANGENSDSKNYLPIKVFEKGHVINGRFEVVSKLGDGGMGVVYRVVDKLNPEVPVALKMLNTSDINSSHLELFKAEFKTMTELSHPHVAQVFDFDQVAHSEEFFFTMELIEGEDIFAFTETADVSEILSLFVQVCRALSYMHSKGIIHFDLKPSNILVTKENMVKVLDFGIAGNRPSAVDGELAGTPAYMAPEFALDVENVDHRADIYSLGVILYQLFCREVPFDGTSWVKIFYQAVYNPIEFSLEEQENIPVWIQDLILKLCAKEASNRFQNTNEIISSINKAGKYSFKIETDQTLSSYIYSSRFIGRDSEFDTLYRAIQSRLQGELQKPIILLSGQSGIGKSRLMQEVKYRSQLDQIKFIEVNCYQDLLAEFAPFSETVFQLAQMLITSEHKHILDSYGDVLALFEPSLETQLNIKPAKILKDPYLERKRRINTVTGFIKDVSDVMPFVLYINDLQWGRTGTIELLDSLVDKVVEDNKTTPLVIICSFRSEDISSSAAMQFTQKVQENDYDMPVHLKPLGIHELETFLLAMLGTIEFPKSFIENIMKATQGVPFWIEEYIRHAAEKNFITIKDGRWEFHEVDIDQTFQLDLKEIFFARTKNLSHSTQTVLKILAATKKPVDWELLAEVSSDHPQTIFKDLTFLMQRKMVIRLRGKKLLYTIAHGQMGESIYSAIEDADKKQLHFRIASGSLYLYEEHECIYDLAFHFTKAGHSQKALHYSIQGGDYAARDYANDIAADLYTNALELVDASDTSLVVSLKKKIADIQSIQGKYEEALAHYDYIATRVHENNHLADLEYHIGAIYWQKGELLTAINHYWNAIQYLNDPYPQNKFSFLFHVVKNICVHIVVLKLPQLIQAVKSPQKIKRFKQLTQIYTALSIAYFFHEPKKTVLPLLRTYNLGVRVEESPELCHATAAIGMLYNYLQLFKAGSDFGKKSLVMAQRLKSPWHIALSNSYYGINCFYQTRWDQALQHFFTARDLFLQYGDMSQLGICYVQISFCLQYKGQFQKMLRIIDEGLDILKKTDSLQMGKALYSHRGKALAMLDRVEEAIESQQLALTMSKETNDYQLLCGTYYSLGSTLLSNEQYAKAVEFFEYSIQLMKKHKINHDYFQWAYALAARALVEQVVQNEITSKKERKRALKQARHYVSKSFSLTKKRYPNYRSPTFLSAAMLEVVQHGYTMKAQQFFEKACEIARNLQSKYFEADALFCEGRFILLISNEREKQAHDKITKAQQLFEDCQAKLPLRQISQYT